MIEVDFGLFITAQLGYETSFGDVDSKEDFTGTVINYFKLPSEMDSYSPNYQDQIQVSIRNERLDLATSVKNEIVELFQGYSGYIGSYLVYVNGILDNGQLREGGKVYSHTITVSLKYTGL